MSSHSQNQSTVAVSIRRTGEHAQRGVVLIIALIMLVVISLLATLSMRNATSSESISGNVRTTELATQAAEIALRYCEDTVVQINGGGVTPTGFVIQNFSSPPLWSAKNGSGGLTNWDGNTSSVAPAGPVLVIPDSSINQAGAGVTFKRPPECMVERMQMADTTTTVTVAKTYVITARGFGPDVAADTGGTRPRPQGGSEVWMQSTIELN